MQFTWLIHHRNTVLYILVFLLLTGVYALTAPRTVVFEDDALFILSAWFNGISHPPGYPLYTLLAHLFTWLPIGSVAWRVHLLSGVFAALGCLCLWWLVNHWFRDRIYACVAALVYGFSATFWSQAIISEVYTLNILIVLVLCILAVHWEEHRDSANAGRILCTMGLVYGLGLSNHWPLLILSTPMVVALMWHCLHLPVTRFLKPALCVLPGLLPYAWMVFRSQMDPEISFYGPIESWSEFWFFISRQGYEEADTNPGAGLHDKLMFGLFVLQENAREFGYAASLLILAGLAVQGRYLQKHVCRALVFGYLGSTLVLIVLLDFNFDQLHRNIFKVYPLVSYFVSAIWLVAGLKYIVEKIKPVSANLVGINFISTGLSVLLTGSVLLTNLPINFRANDNLAEKYARTVLGSLDKNSVFITYSDIDAGPLGYFRKIQNVRPDVQLLNTDGYIYSDRLYKATAGLDQKYRIFADYLRNEDRSVYYIRGVPDLYGYTDFGLYHKIDKSLEIGISRAMGNDRILAFLEQLLLIDDLVDPWELMAQRLMYADHCRIGIHFYMNNVETYTLDNLDRICRGYQSLITLVEVLIEYGFDDLVMLESYLDKARGLRHEALEVANESALEYLYGRLRLLQDNEAAALEHFHRSIEIWPGRRNKSRKYLEQLESSPTG